MAKKKKMERRKKSELRSPEQIYNLVQRVKTSNKKLPTVKELAQFVYGVKIADGRLTQIKTFVKNDALCAETVRIYKIKKERGVTLKDCLKEIKELLPPIPLTKILEYSQKKDRR